MNKIIAILLSISLMVSLVGLNLFSHICNHTQSVATAIIPSFSNCVTDEHSCCHEENTQTDSNSICDTDDTDNIPFSNFNNANIKSDGCCIDIHKYLALETQSINHHHEKIILLNINELLKIDFTIPIFTTIEYSSYCYLDDFLDFSENYHSDILKYIYDSSLIS